MKQQKNKDLRLIEQEIEDRFGAIETLLAKHKHKLTRLAYDTDLEFCVAAQQKLHECKAPASAHAELLSLICEVSQLWARWADIRGWKRMKQKWEKDAATCAGWAKLFATIAKGEQIMGEHDHS